MGDDLASDDEYLSGQVVEEEDNFDFGVGSAKKKSVLQASTVAVLDDDDDDLKKRKRKGEGEEAVSTKKSKPSRQKLLLHAGRAIEQESPENQTSFLWTALVHHHRLKSGKEGNDDDDDEDEETELEPKLQPCHLLTSQATDFCSRLRDCLPSMKQLKTWNHTKSPLAIIVCVSARRAVQVLKEIKPFKTRTAKLFAKHLTVQEQTEWLQQTPFGLAVGTPHRLNVLCQSSALNLNATRLIVLDSHQDSKGFTVCTLPDTAPHCMEFLKDRFLPALRERPKQIKVAFC